MQPISYLPYLLLQYTIPSPLLNPYTLTLFILQAVTYYWASFLERGVYPYMDEIFHIPQAQSYCRGDFHLWDPKLTTPPGLYILSTFIGNLPIFRSCDITFLRQLNGGWLLGLLVVVWGVRGKIYPPSRRRGWEWENAHTGLNVGLFPVLFFFGGLYYTDVLSTAVVLLAYRWWLEEEGGIWIYGAGVVALGMRQTNIFWVAVFLGGLEVVKSVREIGGQKGGERPVYDLKDWKSCVTSALEQWEKGVVHDIPLRDAEIWDFPLCALSIAVAATVNLSVVLRRLIPSIALLVSFALFVVWNGGVVLGDKSNHVATIHLPQLLYMWAMFAFFSLPLLVPSALSLLMRLTFALTKTPTQKSLINLAMVGASLFGILGVIHFNSLIHPFTLSDNRHYMFYVFRYTILLHPLIKYALAPIYLLAFYLCYTTLISAPTTLQPMLSPRDAYFRKLAIKNSAPQKLTEEQIQQYMYIMSHASPGNFPDAPKASFEPAADVYATKTSFFLIWIVATSLSLITAPLVEPRYFIIPWVLWRLHVPPPPATKPSSQRGVWGKIQRGISAGGLPLWGETAWFLAINAVTCWVFLYRGFEWAQEPGVVQRFMW